MALFKLAAFISVAVRRCAAEVFCGASDVGGAREGGIGFHSTGAAVLCGAAVRSVLAHRPQPELHLDQPQDGSSD